MNHPFQPIGVGVNSSGEKIGEELTTLIDTTHLEVLFADGEPGIEALLLPGMRFQRCLVHGRRDFPFLLYADGLKKKEQLPFTQHFDSLPVFSFPQKKLATLNSQDIPQVLEAIGKTRQGFLELLKILLTPTPTPGAGPTLRVYPVVFSPSSIGGWKRERSYHQPPTPLKGAFSRIKNRIRSIGRRWSDQGLLHYLRVALLKIFSPQIWKQFWEDFFKECPPILLKGIRYHWKWIESGIT